MVTKVITIVVLVIVALWWIGKVVNPQHSSCDNPYLTAAEHAQCEQVMRDIGDDQVGYRVPLGG